MKMLYALVLVFTTLSHVNAFAQIEFEKGYIIDSYDKKVICYIKNMDWENNPASFQYKFDIGGEPISGTLSEIKEFGIDSAATYVRAMVPVDYSIADQAPMSIAKEPDWKQEELFLKLLVKGINPLYAYKTNQFTQFYFRRTGGDIVPLIYKTYLGDYGKVETNIAYKQQLWNEMKCESLDREFVSRVRYREEDLVAFFRKYNICKDPTFVDGPVRKRFRSFNLSLISGIDYTYFKSHLGIRTGMDNSLKDNLTFRFGTGIEYIAPFNRGKWALLIEPSFQHYKVRASLGNAHFGPKFWSIEAPMGIRYYLLPEKNLKAFLNIQYVAKIYSRQFKADWFGTEKIRMGNNCALGAGLKMGRLSAELRYTFTRNVFVHLALTSFFASKLSLIVGYRIVK